MSDRITPEEVARHNPLIRVAARLVRGELLPKSGRIAQAEVRRLEESHKLTGIRVKNESDKLRTLIAEQAAEIARLGRLLAARDDLLTRTRDRRVEWCSYCEVEIATRWAYGGRLACDECPTGDDEETP